MSSGLKAWPKDWPRYQQPCYRTKDSVCDTLVGPCACGAWHKAGEFEFRGGKLYRNGEQVPTLEKP